MKNVLDVGGQAVIEGVMMKSLNFISIAVRTENGDIVTKLNKIRKFRFKFFRAPFIRGFVTLLYIMILGIKALIWSSQQALEEEEENLSAKEIFLTVSLSLGLAIGIFVALPYLVTTLLGINEPTNPIIFNAVDGVIKTLFFILYILLIALMPDIKRLFQYHGAEHKAVNCYEANLPLTVENAKSFTTIHPRCGTTFIVVTFVVSILVFSLVPAAVLWLFPIVKTYSFWAQRGILFAARLLFLPFVSGVSYELLRLGAKYYSNSVVRTLLTPGFWFQRLTTKEPDDQQLEVALASLNEVLKSEGSLNATPL
jgi:uncharacterized protein YqhQ